MTGTMNNGTSGARMDYNRPERTNQGGNQSKGGNYENPGGNSTGTMGTQMNAGTTSGQPDSSELSTFMNNGGGPEPHQGNNPGAQSDPGPKEIGFYDQARNHVLGDDGIQAAVERPSPMRMGGVFGSQPNPGQRGGQNTETSGAQTATNYSSPEEYGAGSEYGDGSIPGVTGTRGGNAFAGEQYSGGISTSGGAGNGQTGARTSGNGGGGAMGSETRNPVGFAAGMTDEPTATHVPGHTASPSATHVPGHGGQAGVSGFQGPSGIMHDTTAGGASGAAGQDGDYTYQSRAAQQLVEMRRDSPTTYTRMDEPAEDLAPRAADKAGEVADAVKDKAGGFFSNAKDRVEDFLNVDLDSDGEIGAERATSGSDVGRQRASTGGKPDSDGTFGGYRGVAPEAFEIHETTPRDAAPTSPRAFETKETTPRDEGGAMPDLSERSVMRADGVSRTDAQQRELVDA